jgi:hypothetical protein
VIGNDVVLVASASSLTDIVSALLLIVGVGFGITVGTVVLITVTVARRVRRSPAIASAALHYRVVSESGPRREVAKLRLQLWRAVEGGRVTVGQADAAAGLAGEAPALFKRLQREAATVDQLLRVLQSETDPAALRAALPEVRARVTELTDLVQRLRSAVAAGLGAASDGAMAELGAEVEREVVALRAGRERMQDLGGRAVDRGWNGREALR